MKAIISFSVAILEAGGAFVIAMLVGMAIAGAVAEVDNHIWTKAKPSERTLAQTAKP